MLLRCVLFIESPRNTADSLDRSDWPDVLRRNADFKVRRPSFSPGQHQLEIARAYAAL